MPSDAAMRAANALADAELISFVHNVPNRRQRVAEIIDREMVLPAPVRTGLEIMFEILGTSDYRDYCPENDRAALDAASAWFQNQVTA